MKLLLDTHVFVWWDSDPTRLSSHALALCQDQESTLLLSVASIWEIQIKFQLGKVRLNLPLSQLIENQQQTNDMQVLPVKLDHVLALDNLPPHHKDPFDRLLIAQANVEGALLVSADPVFAHYPVRVAW